MSAAPAAEDARKKGGGGSVFHLPSGPVLHAQCLAAVESYAVALERLQGVGVQAADAFAALLAHSPYAEIAGQFHARSLELEALTKADAHQLRADLQSQWAPLLQTSEDAGDHTSVVARGLAQLLQTQLHFFQAAMGHLVHLTQYPAPHQLPSKAKTPSQPSSSVQTSPSEPPMEPLKKLDSPNRIKKHFSSFFSKFGSGKNAPSPMDHPPQSAFYVDLGSSEAGPSDTKKEASPTPSAGTTTAEKVGEEPKAVPSAGQMNTPPKKEEEAADKMKGDDLNGHIATQEELDLVINMLSKRPSSMQSIPEVPRVDGGQFGHYPAQWYQQHLQQHPRPADDFMRNAPWLYKPHQPPTSICQDEEVWKLQQMRLAGGWADVRQPPPQGPTSHHKLWTQFPTHEILHQMGSSSDSSGVVRHPSHWSTTADSSSCSDESSSNGEMPWMMGIDPVMKTHHRRRHSSGENPAITINSAVPMGTVTMDAPSLNKSVESLLEPKSTNTWPPKHPWVSEESKMPPSPESTLPLLSSTLKPPIHRPLTNQWSDPLSTARLSVWEPGCMMLGGQQMGRQSHGNLPTSLPPEVATGDLGCPHKGTF